MKPIFFNTEMVKAILDGRKTVTRRVIEPQPNDIYWKSGFAYYKRIPCGTGWYGRQLQPIYIPGDTLYACETFARVSDWTTVDTEVGLPDGYIYKADWPDDAEHPKWRPSIHMPKEAARIFLRVVNVSVERLQDIQNDETALQKEGVAQSCLTLLSGAFVRLWDNTIKKADMDKYGWAANPWCWVISFEKISKEDA